MLLHMVSQVSLSYLIHTLFSHEDVDDEMQSTELQFKFSTISAATDNFSEANKLGEGGFGSVYK
ncbi:hypothetical protein MKW94_012393, partial [Papaver nudicaule]|nr:hypothetical protein [Papaver nudicaule]